MSALAERQERYYRGIRMVPYDLVKELAVAMAIVLVVIAVLAAALSSPDIPPLTVQQWAHDDPVDFVTTATSELAKESTSAQYGPPYNDGDASVQSLGPFSPQAWAGPRLGIDPAQEFVLQPLQDASVGNVDLASALKAYGAADAAQQRAWLDAYTTALANATEQDGHVVVVAGDYGPVPVLEDSLLQVARSGGLDGLLLSSGRFYETDFTRPLLFMGDGSRLSDLAQDQHLAGDQWGMMNETGQYPGQIWLWLYTVWYQLPAFQEGGAVAPAADLVVVLVLLLLTMLLALVPFIPGLRDIPRWIPIHRLIWRHYYRTGGGSAS